MQLQGALPAGFAAPWATGPGLYPFLTTFFPDGVQAVSGFAYKDAGATPLASGLTGAATVSADANGAMLGSATTGANGYYYVFAAAGSTPAGANVVAYTQADAATGSTNAATYFVSAGAGNSSGNSIFGSTLTETTPSLLYSQLAAGLANAAGADGGAPASHRRRHEHQRLRDRRKLHSRSGDRDPGQSQPFGLPRRLRR